MVVTRDWLSAASYPASSGCGVCNTVLCGGLSVQLVDVCLLALSPTAAILEDGEIFITHLLNVHNKVLALLRSCQIVELSNQDFLLSLRHDSQPTALSKKKDFTHSNHTCK